jgi:hypothetical protein
MRLAIFTLLATVAAGSIAGTAWAADTPTFYTDAKSGCQVGTFYPDDGLTLSWTGPCVNGKAQGRGIAEWSAKGAFASRSEGDFRAGLREGKVLTVDKDNNIYGHEYHGGRANGSGITMGADGMRYDGQFRNDKFDGHGKLLFADGDRYEGEFHDGMFNGHGVYVSKSGYIYDGNYVNDKREGLGRLVGSNGAWYQGEFAQGKYNGQGSEVFGDGGWYQGHLVDGLPDGAGQYVGKALDGTGNVWVGQWHQGCLRMADGKTAAAEKSRAECGFN